MRLVSRQDGNASNETLVLVALVALGGITGLTLLGTGARNAIAGKGEGDDRGASTGTAVMVASLQAGTGSSGGGGSSPGPAVLTTDFHIPTAAERRAANAKLAARLEGGAAPSATVTPPSGNGGGGGAGAASAAGGRGVKPSKKHRDPDADMLRDTRTKNLLLSLATLTNGNHGEAGKPPPVTVDASMDQAIDAMNRTPDPSGKLSAAEVIGHIQFWGGHFSDLSDFDLAKRRGENAVALNWAKAVGDQKNVDFLKFVDEGMADEQNVRRYEDAIIAELNRRGKTDSPTFGQSITRLLNQRGGRPDGVQALEGTDLDGINAMRDEIAEKMDALEKGEAPLTSDQAIQAQALQGTDEILMHEQFVRGKRTIAPAATLSTARAQAGGVIDRSQWPHYSSPRDFGYTNARIPADRLEPVDDEGHRLWYPAAVRFRAMKAAMEKAGVYYGLADAYRDYDTQSQAYYSKGPGGRGEVAVAKPGTSNHGWGMAVDITIGNGTFEWLSAHAADYGFDNVEGASVNENWHWGYTGVDER